MKLAAKVLDWAVITFATAIVAASVFFFMMPANLSISSITGLAIVLKTFIPLSVPTITLILNLFLLALGFALIGRSFGIKTVYCAILLPTMIGILERLFPQGGNLTTDPLLDMVCHCFFVSVGLAILFNRNASSGGLDIVAKLMNKYLRMELGNAMSVAGMCVACSSLLVYDIKTGLLSILGTYLNGVILDRFLFGSTLKKRVCIVSSKFEEIRKFIVEDLHSGATLYQTLGAYNLTPRTEIITIVDKNEYLRLMSFLTKTDPDAFITVYSVSEMQYKPKPKK